MNKIDPIIEADSLTRDELKVIRHYFSTPGSVPDWPLIQTSKGKVKGPIIGRLIADLERSMAERDASRALVAAQRKYIQTRAEIHKTGEAAMSEEWRQENCSGCQAESALALTEADKRLEGGN